jgi:hypothetical protein
MVDAAATAIPAQHAKTKNDTAQNSRVVVLRDVERVQDRDQRGFAGDALLATHERFSQIASSTRTAHTR